jgi:nicotinamide-nucleotide amidase
MIFQGNKGYYKHHMPAAEIIAIGTELLLGETADTNTRFIARRLREVGIDLFHAQIIGDNAKRISNAVQEAMNRADIIITTGGLGPTVDDPTRKALADAAGVPLEFHPELWEQIQNRISRYGRTPTENQKRQAYIPKGAIIIENPVGTAPAFIIKYPIVENWTSKGIKVISALPGVPKEMETLLNNNLLPYLQREFALKEIISVKTLHVSGMGEGTLDERIGDFEVLDNPTVGLTAHSGVVDIRIAAKADSNKKAGEMIAGVESDLRRILKDDIFGSDDDTLEGVISDFLTSKGWRLACVEKGLGSALLNRFSKYGASSYLGGTTKINSHETLQKACESRLKELHAEVCLGLSITPHNQMQDLSVVVISPLGIMNKNRSYAGHPQNAVRWSVNTGLDLLRRHLMRMG